MAKDDRRDKRVMIRLPISIVDNQGVTEGTLFNLSNGGCAIESTARVHLGTTLKLRVHVPSEDPPIEVEEAGVMWTASGDFGVKFLHLGSQEQARLQRLLEQPPSQQEPPAQA